MPTPTIKDLHQVDSITFEYIYEQNVTIQLPDGSGLVRCNVYRPKAEDTAKFPVLVTYGPYGKDIPYETWVTRALPSISIDDADSIRTPTPN